MAVELVVVEPSECRPLRRDVLHGGREADAVYPTDEAEGAMHLALKEDDAVLAVASVLPERRGGTAEMWRLGGLAVVPKHRGRGLGTQLVRAVQMIVGERGGGLWCEAPESARAFLAAQRMEPCEEGAGAAANGRLVLVWSGR